MDMTTQESGAAGRTRPGWRAALEDHGHARLTGFIDRATAALAAASDRVPDEVLAALADLNLGGPVEVRRLSHPAGEGGLPPLPGRYGFVLDLSFGWRSQDGGLLLFQDDAARVRGWRPEAGALTLFDNEQAPVLSVIAPTARAPRLCLIGGFA